MRAGGSDGSGGAAGGQAGRAYTGRVPVYHALHLLLIGAYLVAPAALLVSAARRRRRPGAAWTAVRTFVAGGAIGAGLTGVYAVAGGAPFPPGQALLAGYFAVGLLVLLGAFDAVVANGASWAVGYRRSAGRAGRRSRWRGAAVQVARLVALGAFGLPWVLGAVMAYRPKVLPADDPASQLGFRYDAVTLRASDGVELAGWWLPCQSGASDRTVVVCHGLGAGKSNQLVLAGAFAFDGYNALIFDFRAHGGSGGQVSSFGDLERRDVRAAVDWATANRPDAAAHVFGAGVSMGAAALVAEAGDDPRVEAVALFSTFDTLPDLAGVVAGQMFVRPVDRWMAALVLPVASMHAGADLSAFAPAESIARLWPRPVLVIHGGRDRVIPFRLGRRLYDAASFPRESLWLPGADHDSTITDPRAVRAAREFFRTAERVPGV